MGNSRVTPDLRGAVEFGTISPSSSESASATGVAFLSCVSVGLKGCQIDCF